MIRSTVAHIDLDRLAHNFESIGAYLARVRPGQPPPGIIPVIKANAYGHGAEQVALTVERCGATMVACADIEEAITLRRTGLRCRILVFGALSLSDLDGIFDHALTPTISTPTAARALQEAAKRRGVRLAYHLKIDTGMNRLGFRHDNLERTMPALVLATHLDLEAVYTHFATADAPGGDLFAEQLAHFETARAALCRRGLGPRVVHAANSAALLADPAAWFDCVRPGLLLYGVTPHDREGFLTLKPVMSLTSRVVAVKGVRVGETVGYGARFRAVRPTTVAIVPAGYADGLDTRLEGRGSVLVRGHRAPIVGSVCMDMMTVDVTGLAVTPGDAVVIVGEQDGAAITMSEIAAAIGTIPYELLCRVGARIQRVYNHTGC